MKRHGNLIPEIVEWRNMDDAFDEVVSDLKGERPEAYQERKAEIIADLQLRIGDGSFRINPDKVKQFYTEDGPKIRLIQSPDVIDRIGCNAVMRVVEKYLYPTVIRTSAASIKGRGMHRLFRKMRSDIRHDREGTANFYLCDIEKFYDNIDQQMVRDIVRTKIKDPVLLPILDDFITLLDRLVPPTAPIPYGHQRKKVVIPHREKGKGLCIGLRSSQCFGNLLLSRLGHRLKEREGVRYLYIYCDDIRVYGATKRWLWHIRDIIHEEIEGGLRLRIKRNEAVRPTTEGNDFLGYVDYGDHSRLRKRTKQKAARKLARVKSRKRRQELIGSFKGMAKWGDCHHLYKLLTGEEMAKEFKDFGIQYVAEDGKKRFGGKTVSLRELSNMHITVIDYEKDVKTDNGLRTLVSFEYDDGKQGKYFTADKQQEWYLDKLSEMGELPFGTTIKSEAFGNGKVRYIFT